MIRSKYGNKRTEVDGFLFDSKAEANRWSILRLYEEKGDIGFLERQVPFKLIVNGQLIATYKADFRYATPDGSVVEDVKGVRTEAYKLKKKLMKALYNIDIVEIQA